MIITLKGNVAYTITLDPSVWIFDDRKIAVEDYMSGWQIEDSDDFPGSRPPVMESLEKFKKAGSDTGSYVMALSPFIERAEPSSSAAEVQLLGSDGNVRGEITIEELNGSSLLFSIGGKQIRDQGPAYLYISPEHEPIKDFSAIVII